MKKAKILGIVPATVRWICPNKDCKSNKGKGAGQKHILSAVYPGTAEIVGKCPVCGKYFVLEWQKA